ncbi:carbamoyltransferase HypF [Antrihabitans sp. YC2-6]|uniref:carbamoyltransferase HypF n=1 Tax=Antrihabitans sp. YC2-6 TaxID=2799498 RepID=UPI0018F5677D|nr:carbamoyltransferase HypF [Antrihabitans sp. YC2-6]MBJ8348458.1 carbamoyltransferase HypF [Antrihabitans sp. YC2-6]
MTAQLDPALVVGNKVDRRRIIVRGIVQGVGFRPFVARLAAALELSGHCGNDDSSVFIEVEGPRSAVDSMCRRLRNEAPPLSVIVDIQIDSITPRGDRGFRIVDSRHLGNARTLIPPDVATCTDCLLEFTDPADRRYRHPFVNCTNCGPRFTVITDLPYDRPATTMAIFPMCARCRLEYDDPADRRYHAQPISCHDCGPRISFRKDGTSVTGDADVLRSVQDELAAGRTVAVKGLGGFHLVCDATSSAAVARLRDRKRRQHKPFAVLARDLRTVDTICRVDDVAADLLTSPARPIVLLPSRPKAFVAPEVAPHLDELGVLLPYTALHHLLFGPDTPPLLVMTSGNRTDEPLCFDNDDALHRLSDIADAFLLHDRPIAVPCEDSVLTTSRGRVVPIRRSRGFAPLPVALPAPGPVVLAVGAEVKNTFCLTRQDYAFCSAHLGDMGSLESQRAFERSVEQMTAMHAVTPELVVADDHPGYSTRHWAQRYSDALDVPLRTVQHHHAHIASLLAEHGRTRTAVLGVAFDGTGYGCDRTVWGGEFLAVGPNILDAQRAGHLRSFWLPGGDVAVRTPARVALALLAEAGIPATAELACSRALDDTERALVDSQLRTGTGCARTTSVGRLFDGVSALLGVCQRASYEAQAAIELEALARSAARPIPLDIAVASDVLDFAPMLDGLLTAIRAGADAAELALGFHHALATATAELATRSARERNIPTIGLTGGVFGNRLLSGLLQTALENSGFEVLTHNTVPSNDGGLCLGQAVLGIAMTSRG